MRVKYVILDGFKSYGTRTHIGPFDPHFNAITGLNGSGKSNILDGIAFVLGLSALNTVRAEKMQDLIFKGGSVKRCSVSLVFENDDKRPNKCPIGYEKFDEIIVSRTIEEGHVSKYYLNSIVTTKKAVSDLFESVQLNVNNANFMIMQGKITKVVNMKPKEILNMIEECTGANAYQHKRDRALQEMQTKERLINEINETLKSVILPSLKTQSAAYELYQEFKEVEKNRRKIAQNYAIAAYGHYILLIEKKEEEVLEFQDREKEDGSQIQVYNQQIADKQKRRAEIKKETQKITSEKVSGIEKEVKEERKRVAAAEVAVDTAASAVKEASSSVKNAKKALATEEKQIADFKQKSGKAINEFTSITKEIEQAKLNLAASKEKESEVNAGKVLGDDGQTFDLRERLVVVEDEIGKIRPNYNHEEKLQEQDKKKLNELSNKLKNTTSDAQIEKNFSAAESEVKKLEKQLQQLNISADQYAASDAEYNNSAQKLNDIERQRRQFLTEFPYLDFEYTPPTPNFDQSKVLGQVYELFDTPDLGPYRNAMEVAVGGCLNVVVVDDVETSKQIIKNGNVATRRTYMPLSKVQAGRKPPTQAEIDRKVGGPGKAASAYSLIRTSPEHDKLMQYYFGRAILCDTMATAKTIAYSMGYKAITIEGDVCDPDGGMQGGTRKNLGRLFTACQVLRTLNKERNELKKKVRDLKEKMDLYQRNGPLLKRYDQAKRQLNNAMEERQCTAYASLAADVEALKKIIGERQTRINEMNQNLAKWTKEQATLRRTLDSFEEVKAKGLKTARADIAKWTKALESAQKKYDSQQATFNSMDMDLKAKESMLDDLRKDVEKAEKELEAAIKTQTTEKENLEEVRLVFEEKQREQKEAAEELVVWDEEYAELEKEIGQLQKRIDSCELSKIKRDNDLKNLEAQIKSGEESVQNLVKKHPELKLTTHYDNLEKPNQSMKKCKEELDTIEKRYENLVQRIDPEAGDKLEETKELESASKKRVKQLEKNRKDMQLAIETLDDKKRDLVLGAFKTINEEFGKMMTILLPESTAKLVPVTSVEKLEDGLNIHVCLGNVWKESLTELSGGQRSLVALALVLSLCLYEPAPLYILDEIDSALDLSHTQNIGLLIKQRFKDTQFICVSLKDGMYTNANVLFTTRFEESKSSVTRVAKTDNAKRQADDADKYSGIGKKREKGVRGTRRH